MSSIAYIRQEGISHGINFDAHYTIKGWRGIAFVLLGWSAEETTPEDYDDEPELVPCFDCVVAVMVGDDKRHVVDVGDLTLLGEDKFCHSCGQVGCHCNVYA